ncbi:hypothetical protein [Spirillospora sp. NPDC047279]|uniref:hypothetical protein n=1 Tax=Spirillospora sp. NPDC047279 TaxID=3155478 RepID=UPI0033F7CDD3
MCCAEGDGLGHLTRVRAALHTLGYGGRPVTILSGSPFAADPRVVGDVPVRRPPPGLDRAGLNGWTAATLAGLAPAEVIIDAFPAGLRGELTADAVPDGTRVTHLARLLRWDAYRPLLPDAPPRFDRTFVLEPLHPRHLAHLEAVSAETTPLRLTDPEPPEPAAGAEPGADLDGWLIVHSGPDAEILELLAYARETAAMEGLLPRLTLAAPHRPSALPDGVAHLDVYPVWPLASRAERIITAAGFNTVRQFAPWRAKHRVVPFPRSLDDQYARAAAYRHDAGADAAGQAGRSKVTPTSSASLRAPKNAE